MPRLILLIVTLFIAQTSFTQESSVFDGKVKVVEMDNDQTSTSLVVRQADGTLAKRDAHDIIPHFSVSFTGDTLFQSNGGWIIIPGISAANHATYRVTFQATWSAATHPNSFPFNPHFSGLIGMTHNDAGSLFELNALASTGIKNMAEFGSKSPLTSEIQSFIAQKKGQSLISGGGVSLSPGSVSVDFNVSNTHTLVSLVSMVAPSPDWFIGVRDIELFENGTWVPTKTVNVNIYDSGTDSGPSYTSSNQVTIPQVPIFMITDAPLGTNGVVPTMGTMTFERLDD